MSPSCNACLRMIASLLFLVAGRSEAFFVIDRSASAIPKASSVWSSPSRRPHDNPSKFSSSSSLHALDGAAAALDSFYQSQPYVSAFVTCCIKAGAADFLAQTNQQSVAQVERQQQSVKPTMFPHHFAPTIYSLQQQHQRKSRSDTGSASNSSAVDGSRCFAFICYGGIYQGLWQQFLYTNLFPSWLSVLPADLPPLAQVAFQVAIEMSLIGPLLCLPTAYAIKSMFTAPTPNTMSLSAPHPLVATSALVREGLDKYVQDCTKRGLLFKYWALWIPVDGFVFSVVPLHLRVVFIATVSFFWVFVLSATAADTS
jgi:hypothetical protein